jgi:hypothetical protein
MERYELFVRGDIPRELDGSLILCSARRSKDHHAFARWHDSPADLIKLDIRPGSPGSVVVEIWPVDRAEGTFTPSAFEQAAARDSRYGYATQPNHGINVGNGVAWGTNLVFGAPLEIDLSTWRPRRLLRWLDPSPSHPRLATTAHFAFTRDGRHAYLQQSLLGDGREGGPVTASQHVLVRIDTTTGESREWKLRPPPGDAAAEAHNFHSAFYWEEGGVPHVGLLRTGAVFSTLAPHTTADEHAVHRMPVSDIWFVAIDETRDELQAELLPGVAELGLLALSHLAVDRSREDGLVLFANSKESDVGEETHGYNIYGQHPAQIAEHYSGMITEAMNVGSLVRYERSGGEYKIKTFRRPYVAGRSSRGHSWLPINIEIDGAGKHLYCTFAGFRPRLLPAHVASAYTDRVVEAAEIRDVPSLLMRFDADTLEPTTAADRSYLSYNESLAIAVVGDTPSGHVLSFSPEFGLRIYQAADLSRLVAHGIGHEMWHVGDTHFRTAPAHMAFVPREGGVPAG